MTPSKPHGEMEPSVGYAEARKCQADCMPVMAARLGDFGKSRGTQPLGGVLLNLKCSVAGLSFRLERGVSMRNVEHSTAKAIVHHVHPSCGHWPRPVKRVAHGTHCVDRSRAHCVRPRAYLQTISKPGIGRLKRRRCRARLGPTQRSSYHSTTV